MKSFLQILNYLIITFAFLPYVNGQDSNKKELRRLNAKIDRVRVQVDSLQLDNQILLPELMSAFKQAVKSKAQQDSVTLLVLKKINNLDNRISKIESKSDSRDSTNLEILNKLMLIENKVVTLNKGYTEMYKLSSPDRNITEQLPDYKKYVEDSKYGMPFYFKDLRDNTYIFFRAFIEGLTENISPNWTPTNYVGRSEPVYTYERAEREISFTLKLVAQTKAELLAIYAKMDRLTSMCYPAYVGDDYGNRMKPPLAKLRYGELYGKTNAKNLRNPLFWCLIRGP